MAKDLASFGSPMAGPLPPGPVTDAGDAAVALANWAVDPGDPCEDLSGGAKMLKDSKAAKWLGGILGGKKAAEPVKPPFQYWGPNVPNPTNQYAPPSVWR
jgi:hypothetical protein